uniref:BRD8 domain containing n=1 Tax=Jaculus jaculus TaxID=51337 RepID=A0A8C5K528_JACJA
VYLQMGCEWVWLDSDQDYPNDSELSNDYRSLFSSWDSSLDLDVGSWRQTEDPDPEAEELEESSSPGREPSELLVGDGDSEESQEGAEQVSQESLLHFLSETALSQGDPIQDHFLFKKTLLQVWKMIASHRFSSPFLKPVSERQAPGYKDVVKRPMDLTTLKRNLSKGRIRTMAEFQRDLMLMFQNAVMYNDSDHHIYHMAVEMQREVLEQMQVLCTWLDKRKDLCNLE